MDVPPAIDFRSLRAPRRAAASNSVGNGAGARFQPGLHGGKEDIEAAQALIDEMLGLAEEASPEAEAAPPELTGGASSVRGRGGGRRVAAAPRGGRQKKRKKLDVVQARIDSALRRL